jgi:hypothetical protein
MMTRKDYKLIAKIVKEHRDDSAMAKAEFAEMVYRMSKAFQYTYENFNSDIFEKACGLDTE